MGRRGRVPVKRKFTLYHYKTKCTDSAFAQGEMLRNLPVFPGWTKEYMGLDQGEENMIPHEVAKVPALVVSEKSTERHPWKVTKIIEGYKDISMWLRTKGWKS